MDNKIIALEHQSKTTENILVVDWSATDVCNYRCSYCPDATHKGQNPFVPINDILGFADKVVDHYKKKLGKDVYFILTGGEVTLYKDFLPLVKKLTEDGNRVGISSNASKPLSFWEQARTYLEHISLSYHSDHTDLDHFIDVVNCVKDHTYAHVNIMVNPLKFDQCIDAAYAIFERTDEITLDVQIVLRDFVEPYEYTDAQRARILEVCADINSRLKLTKERKGYRGLMKWVYQDNNTLLTKPGDIMTNKMHQWKNWQCHIGLEMLVIDVQGNIRRSWCGEGERLGNVKDSVINFPDTPHVCQKEWCTGGISDIMITKKRVLESSVLV